MIIMLRVLRVILCALLLLVSNASLATATHGQPEHPRPIGGALVGFDRIPDFAAPGCPEESPGGAAVRWRYASSGTGRVSHLGRVTYEFTHCTYWDNTITDGVLRLKAANGDQLVLGYTAKVAPWTEGDTLSVWQQKWRVASGTGRFQDAKGSGVGNATTYLPPVEVYTELDLTGTISYNPSNRAMK
jgi:hypothetical protein